MPSNNRSKVCFVLAPYRVRALLCIAEQLLTPTYSGHRWRIHGFLPGAWSALHPHSQLHPNVLQNVPAWDLGSTILHPYLRASFRASSRLKQQATSSGPREQAASMLVSFIVKRECYGTSNCCADAGLIWIVPKVKKMARQGKLFMSLPGLMRNDHEAAKKVSSSSRS